MPKAYVKKNGPAQQVNGLSICLEDPVCVVLQFKMLIWIAIEACNCEINDATQNVINSRDMICSIFVCRTLYNLLTIFKEFMLRYELSKMKYGLIVSAIIIDKDLATKPAMVKFIPIINLIKKEVVNVLQFLCSSLRTPTSTFCLGRSGGYTTYEQSLQ
ncbi:hypothetical protein VNO78_05557 [Psophocarpus tetragonolobus]|uniref:Uncharacterized protein n=1 Tax=Psophocarpus tetragonolobus TaxID=3891 RepID=A0AAN9XQZ1_PSOTE